MITAIKFDHKVRFTQVACGYDFSLALTEDGQIYSNGNG